MVTPAPARSRAGNRVTALRWSRILTQLGHRVTISQSYQSQSCDLLLALHADRSRSSIERFHADHRRAPIVLALTGTDLYRRRARVTAATLRSMQLADRLVVLQPLASREVPKRWRSKIHVIYQSVERPASRSKPASRSFQVCVLGHLRALKDPFRAAMAARSLPATSRIRIAHVGAALNSTMATRTRTEERRNSRYQWLGELPRWRARRVLSRSRLLVVSSLLEGGANVVSEAIGLSVPILASRIPGSVGILGEEYPGYFPVGDTAALTSLLTRCETDAEFYSSLKESCQQLLPLVSPARERCSWQNLLKELADETQKVDGA